jgi:hypothetical protein
LLIVGGAMLIWKTLDFETTIYKCWKAKKNNVASSSRMTIESSAVTSS